MTSTRTMHGLAHRRCLGVGIVELLVAVTIGMVLIAGALGVFVNSRKSFAVNQDISRMLENGNYALDEISRSLQLSGYWGRNAASTLVRRRRGDPAFNPISTSNPATNDCQTGWYADTSRRVEGLNDTNVPYGTTCVLNSRYSAGTDVLVVRHVEPAEIDAADLQNNTVYIRSDPLGAELFVGTAQPPGFTPIAQNFLLRSMAFYVSPFSLTVGDGIPTLKRSELQPGPVVDVPATPNVSEIVVPGVENMQVQFGISTGGDAQSANQYLNADSVTAAQWASVVSVRIWLVVRGGTNEVGFVNPTQYRLPDGDDDLFAPADGYRRLLLTRTVSLRNF